MLLSNTMNLMFFRIGILFFSFDGLNASAQVAIPSRPVAVRVTAHSPRIGFNIAYPNMAFRPASDGRHVEWKEGAEKAVNRAITDGFKEFRIQDVFAQNFIFPKSDKSDDSFTPTLVGDMVAKLVAKGATTVMLVLDGYPITNHHAEWTNRSPPKSPDAALYQERLGQTLQELKRIKLLEMVQFELFNEPEAKKFFGSVNYSDFQRAVRLAMQVLTDEIPAKKLGVSVSRNRIFCCGFTSNFMQGKGAPDSDEDSVVGRGVLRASLFNLLQNYSKPSMPELNGVPLSWHWYPRHGLQNDKVKIPSDIRLNLSKGGSITEFNVDSWLSENKRYGHSNPRGKWMPGYRESNALDRDFTAIFNFAAERSYQSIYLFKLINDDDGARDKGKIQMGFFNSDGCPTYEYVRTLGLLGRDLNHGAPLTPKSCHAPVMGRYSM